jgi:hypothetical protein
MARYLLGANALIDMCYTATSVETWISTVRPGELRMSVISISTARDVMTRQARSQAELGRLKQVLAARLAALSNGGALVLPFTEREAEAWQDWRSHAPLNIIDQNNQAVPVGQDTRMVIATAFANGFELAEPIEAYHDELRDNGLAVLSL